MQAKSDMTSLEKPQHWLDLTEVVVAVGSAGGAIAAIVSQQVLFASLATIPLSVSVMLNLMNRKQLLQADQTAIATMMVQQARLHQSSSPQGEVPNQQQGLPEGNQQNGAEPGQVTPTVVSADQVNLNHAKSYYNRGLTHQRQEEMEKAIADYTEAICLAPSYAKPYYNRGLAHIHLGNKQDALEDLRAAARYFLEQGDITNYNLAKDQSKQLHNLQSRQQSASDQPPLELLFS